MKNCKVSGNKYQMNNVSFSKFFLKGFKKWILKDEVHKTFSLYVATSY